MWHGVKIPWKTLGFTDSLPCYQYRYMYPQVVSSYAAHAKLSSLGRFWCWPSFGEFEGPVGSSYVNRLLPDYFLPIINQYSRLSSSE